MKFHSSREKNNSKKSALSRRSRYYGDLIDVQLLNSGVDYEKLPELVTIFILPFDPFGENAMYYEAGTIVKTHPHVPYDDGIRRIYLYVNGDLPDNAADDDRQLQVLLKYINESTTENATDELTKRLDGIVKSTKAKKDIGIRYMKSWERERELKEEGREEMREEMQEKLDSAEERAINAEKRAINAERRAEAAEKRLAEHGLL